MKNTLISIVTILSISFLSAPTHSEEHHAVISPNSAAYAKTGGSDDAFFHIYNVEPNTEMQFTVERTEFDNGPTAHYKVEIAGTNIFYYSLYEGNVFSATFPHDLPTNPMTLRILDVNRIDTGDPAQDVKLTLTQVSYSTVVYSEEFTNGMNGWETYVNGSASASSYTRWPGELFTTISDPGHESWHVHVRKTGIPLVQYKDYKVKIRANKENGDQVRVAKVRIEEDGGNYTGYGEKYIVLDDLAKEYSFIFRSPVTTSNAVLCIEMGEFNSDEPVNITVDYIKILKQ